MNDVHVYRPAGLVDCATNVVSEQCGEEIAAVSRSLSLKVMQEAGCTKLKRQYSTEFA